MSRRLSRRLSAIAPSPTLAIKAEAERLRASGVDVVDFGPGEPDLPSPEAVKRAGIEAIENDFTHYTVAAGIPELRQAIAAHYSGRAGVPVDAREVIVGAGGKSVLFLVMLALLDPGDEVVIPAPYWVSFPEQVRLAGARPVPAALDPGDGFTIRAELLERVLTPATRMLLLNSPANPSGAVLPPGEARKIVELAVERDLWVVSDETYESFVYEQEGAASLLAHRPELGDRLVFVSAFSKSWAMTGWRIGYAIAAPEVISAVVTLQSHDTTHASSVSQKAALAALSGSAASEPARTREIYRRRRDRLVAGLRAIPGVSCPVPRGAFYVFPDVRELARRRGFATTKELCEALIREQAVATVPGEAFGVPGHIRLSYACSTEAIDEGLARLRAFAGA
ncbi:MAG: pyridoxal phosphate-dependent aminotransferase [Acidobacteria bacterium]|nr:MAG: pyridoxal phosphate-dependent aminotransferase [Acidobacteriota bacterium]